MAITEQTARKHYLTIPPQSNAGRDRTMQEAAETNAKAGFASGEGPGMEDEMRIILAGIAAAIALVTVDVQSGSAQNTTRPYCMRGGTYGPASWDCSYHTMQQCLESASGLNGVCGPNPFYQGRSGSKRRHQVSW